MGCEKPEPGVALGRSFWSRAMRRSTGDENSSFSSLRLEHVLLSLALLPKAGARRHFPRSPSATVPGQSLHIHCRSGRNPDLLRIARTTPRWASRSLAVMLGRLGDFFNQETSASAAKANHVPLPEFRPDHPRSDMHHRGMPSVGPVL